MRAKYLATGLLFFIFTLYAASLLKLPLLFLAILYTASLSLLIVAFVFGIRLFHRAIQFLFHLNTRNRKIALLISISVLSAGFLASGIAALNRKGEIEDPESRRAELRTFPYLNWASNEKNIHYAGVVLRNPEAGDSEFNFYSSKLRAEAYIMDMEGNYRHTWKVKEIEGRLHNVELDQEGNLFAIGMGSLFKLNWNGDLLWKYNDRIHHDLAIASNGDICTISNRDRIVIVSGIPVPIFDDLILILSPAGKLKKEISLYDILREHNPSLDLISIYRHALKPRTAWTIFQRKTSNWQAESIFSDPPFDRFHANSIEVVNQDIQGFCKKGDLLLSVREQDIVIVVNPDTGKVTWSWSPGWRSWQHDATLLRNGNILLFDNSPLRGYSRVLEINPRKSRIVWQHVAHARENLFSPRMGGCQRLPNVHTLITESDSGRVFEVDSRGGIVWEFYNPEFDKKKNKRATIYKMTRIIDAKINSSIRRLLESSN